MLAHLANVNPRKVMRDSDVQLADLDSPLTAYSDPADEYV